MKTIAPLCTTRLQTSYDKVKMHKAVQQKQGIQRNNMQSHLNLRVELGKSNTNQENHSLLLLSRNNLKSNSIHQQKTFLKRSHVTMNICLGKLNLSEAKQ